MHHFWRTGLRVSLVTLILLTAASALAQPFGAWLTTSGDGHIRLPDSPALDFTGRSFTFEAWVAISNTSGCHSIAGNAWQQSQWLGWCDGKLRSYMRGSGSNFDAGTITSKWTHIAVTFDNDTKVRTHYIDGEVAGTRVDAGPITASTGAWRIWNDEQWNFTPTGAIDEVRFWSVARTKEQIRESINQTIRTPSAVLKAVYGLDANANDDVGTIDGTKFGGGGFLNHPIGVGCTSNATTLCVGPGGRYAVQIQFQTAPATGAIGQAQRVPLSTSQSGLFTFFGADNWEVMVKVLNGCGLNNRWWVFTAATTNVHYEVVVTDATGGASRHYFNFSGISAPAITDTSAFATCP